MKVIADEKVLGNHGDFARKLGASVCAIRDNPQIFDGYHDPRVLILGLRTKLEAESYGDEKVGQKELWYYSADREHLVEVRQKVLERLKQFTGETKEKPTISEVHELSVGRSLVQPAIT